MTINDAIRMLLRMRDEYGDVEIITDCQHCGKETKPDKIVAITSNVRVALKQGD
jgi:uncharacterized protein (UPF0212 family)